ncbi:putative bifunctional diguanylate cyclase/phosphodiesterase [Fusibacter sp. JL216-2]|uniref:putative bifunctional diguanylate cyclase/phosphodiesterase n=1 Tax=Fusibacter sp. JL216-2 TaxID=3071453 RepID=UPI003D339009
MYIIKNNAIRILCSLLIIGSSLNILTNGSNLFSFSTLNSLITIGIVCTFVYFDHKEKAKFNDIFMIDPLTKLPNKYGLENYFINHIKGNSKPYGLITLDIDDFKMINDRYGHKTGDSILINLSKSIKTTSGSDAFICRSYGDEFSVLFPCKNEEDAIEFAERLFNRIKSFLNDNSVITLSNLSMGISLYPEHAANFQDLYKFADHALFYRKHEAGKNGYTVYSNEIFHVAHEEEELAQAFNEAMDKNQILLNFQPQIHSESMKVVGAEVLTRWNHPEKGQIYPDRFIPIAEKNNLMRKLDFYVFRQACKQLKAWEKESFYPITLSVNMSTSTICDRDVALILDRIIKEENVDPRYLIVEMTEELGLTDFRLTNDILHEISALGIKIALDDFGKGYSSLIYLEKIPINVLKIDKEFITDIDTNRNARMVYKTISDLASKLDLKVVSEGIETENQLNTLMDISHSVMQGYHFSRPLTLENFSAYMDELSRSQSHIKSA